MMQPVDLLDHRGISHRTGTASIAGTPSGLVVSSAADLLSLVNVLTFEPSGSFRVLSHFLALEAARIRRSDGLAASGAFEEVRGRVLAVARVHDWLVLPAGRPMADVNTFLGDTCEMLGRTLCEAEGPSLSCETYGRMLPASACVWPTLIASELVTSAVVYGFSDHRGGRVAVTFTAGAEEWILEVEDSGSRWHEDGSRRGAVLRVIVALVQHLDGAVERTTAVAGNRCTVRVPIH